MMVFFFSNAIFALFCKTLIVLLSGPPYSQASLQVSLFVLIGIAPSILTYPYPCVVIDSFAPAFLVALVLTYALVGILIGIFTDTLTIGDLINQVASVSFVYSPRAYRIELQYIETCLAVD